MARGLPAALVSLAEWADGRSVDVLAEAMRVSHSRAVSATCRLCDAHACGHFEGACPVSRAADRLRASA